MTRFDVATARRWGRGAVPGWIPRLVLVLGWILAAGLTAALASGGCSADDPSVCGPDVAWAAGASLTLATPVLLIGFPLLGCATGLLFGVLEQLDEPAAVARIAFAGHGLACGLVLVAMIASRRRQTRVADAVGVRLPAPGGPPPPSRLPVLAAAALLLAAVAGVTLQQWWTARDDRHLAAASRVDATVTAEVDDGFSVRLRLPDREDEATVEVVDHYPVGAQVPVLLDRSGGTPWVALVAEPPDDTFPLSAGLGAGIVAAAVVGWEISRRRMPARLAAGAPAITVLAVRDADEVELWDTDGTRAFAQVDLRPVQVPGHDRAGTRWSPTGWAGGDRLARSTESRTWADDDPIGAGSDWRSGRAAVPGSAPVPMTAIGDLRQGGWIALVDGGQALWPARTLRLRTVGPLRPGTDEDEDDDFRGTPVAPASTDELPLEARPPRRVRLVGAVMLVGFAVGPLAAAFLADTWFQTALGLSAGGRLGFAGLGRLHVGVRLEPDRLVIRERFHVVPVPWAAVHDVHRDGTRLRIAWLPAVLIDVGPFRTEPGRTPEERAEQIGAIMMRRRALAQVAGEPGTRPVGRLGAPAMIVAVLYAAAAVAAILLR